MKVRRSIPRWAGRSALAALLLSSPLADGLAQTNNALPQYSARLWQMEDGLPHTIVQAITQSRDGFLWVGTREGLARFDGVAFRVFDFGGGLVQPSVMQLCEDRDGGLWIGTENAGLFCLSGGQVTHFGLASGLKSDVIGGIQQTDDGVVWVLAGGLARFHAGRFDYPFGTQIGAGDFVSLAAGDGGELWVGGPGVYRLWAGKLSPFAPVGGPLPGLRCLARERGGRLWAGHGQGLSCVDERGLATFRKGINAEAIVGAVLPDRAGNVWVGTYSGLGRFADGRFVPESGERGSSYRVFCLFEDHEGNAWAGSEEGLLRLTPRSFTTYTTRQGLSQNSIASVCASRDGSIWIGVWGGGVNHFTDGVFSALGRTNGLSNDFILALHEARDGTLWAGVDYWGGLYRLTEADPPHFMRADWYKDPVVTAMLDDEQGNFWVGSRDALTCYRDGQCRRFTQEQGLSNNKVNALCAGHEGVVWIGTERGLSRWHNGALTNLAGFAPCLGATILSLYEDAQRALWIGTRGAGVICFKAGTTRAFTTRQGLFSDSVYAILEDDSQNLWFNSSRGIFRVRKAQLDAVAGGDQPMLACAWYGKMDGIASSGQYREVTQPAACKTPSGELWFRTTHGVVRVDPNVSPNVLPPRIAIVQVLADKVVANPALAPRTQKGTRPVSSSVYPQNHPLTIPPGRGELEIHYTALSFRAPEKNRFKYQLEGVDPEWVEADTRRVAYYNNLPPGEYAFRVIAANNDGVWNDTGAVAVLVLLPHYWETAWFRVLCWLGGLGLVTGVVLYATRRHVARRVALLERRHAVDKERARIARDLHDNLGARLTEILMLNELSRKQSLPDEAKSRTTRSRVSHLLRDLVGGLDAIVWATDPKNDSLDNFVFYIYEYLDSLASASSVRILRDVPASLPPWPLSAEQRHNLFLVLKEALNNVFKHAEASEVWFRLRLQDVTLEFAVEDNGRGFVADSTSKFGNGMVNMEKRMQTIGGTFAVTSQPGGGTRIQLRVPMKEGMRDEG